MTQQTKKVVALHTLYPPIHETCRCPPGHTLQPAVHHPATARILPTRSGTRRRDDGIMYRQVLAERADDVLRGPRATMGPPWARDHRAALAATIVGG